MTASPRIIASGLLLTALSAGAQTALPKRSPFELAGSGPAVTAAENETLEFAGVMSSIGKKTDVIIHDKASKRKHWIAVGETVDGISVVMYDPAREQAVVRVNGTEKVLALRKPTRTSPVPGAVMPVPTGFNVAPPPVIAPPDPAQLVQKIQPPPPADAAAVAPAPAPAAPSTPAAQAKAETEARMLVSDLLEIGMAQRKAYEEAQRKAAGGGTEQQPGTTGNQPPAQTPPGTPPDQTQGTATPPPAGGR